MAAILREAMAEGAWGLSTSFLDVDQSGRPVPSRQAEGAEFDALFDVLQEAGRGVVEVVPDLLGPTAMDTLRDLGQRCGRAASRSRGPGSPTSTRRPTARSGGSTSPPSSPSRAR